jgi:lysyl-tRNA synthetase, class II
MEATLSEQQQLRRQKLEQLRQLGIDPYPSETFETNTSAREILDTFMPGREDRFASVKVTGRIMTRRIMGKASFTTILDEDHKIQLYFNRDSICEGEDKTLYNTVFKKLIDIGDIIGVEGYVFSTQTGETTIHVTSFKLLCKSIRPLPIVKEKDEKVYDAFSSPEQRYRQRYVDLLVNRHVRDIFRTRTAMINAMRNFFNAQNYLEVETPVLQPVYGGASARPFTTRHNTLDMKLYLRIANELYLKRLIVGGLNGVYEFAKDFRNEGMSRFHNPEFTQVELYVAFKDYIWMMDMTERMTEKVVKEITGDSKVTFGKHAIDFKTPWPRYTLYEKIQEDTGYDLSNKSEDEIFSIAKELDVDVDKTMGRGKLIDEIFGECSEPKIIQPTFITDYPVEMSPLAKKHRNNPDLVERFEVICAGKEIMNAFSELNDPIEQRKRFEEQIALGKRGDDEAMMLDEDFLRALEYGMPPAAGLGIGIDRLTMILTDAKSIQEVILFPQMRPEKGSTDNIDNDS